MMMRMLRFVAPGMGKVWGGGWCGGKVGMGVVK